MKNDILILASSSPRRIQLLKNAQIPFKIIEHQFDENSVKISNPKKLAPVLAEGKALSIAKKDHYKKNYVLGVDTIVSCKNKILGKPRDKLQAEEFIRLLSGNTHEVITGLSIVNLKKSVIKTSICISKVKFSSVSENFIKLYLDKNLWEGYAGGYAIQESIFDLVVEKIKGSYSNIVGLPVNILYKMLKNVDFIMSV